MNATQWLLLAVLSLPVLEIFLLIQMVSGLGFFITLALLLGSALLGIYLLRNQGWLSWRRVHEALQRGEIPAAELLDASLIALGGGLLLFPGFLSDLFALVCLVPFTRAILASVLSRHELISGLGQSPLSSKPSGIIEGEFKRDP